MQDPSTANISLLYSILEIIFEEGYKAVRTNTENITKMISGYKNMNYGQRLEKLNLTTLEERHHRPDMIQVFKVINDRSNVYPVKFLELNERPGRKNSLKLYKKRYRLELSKNGFTSRVVDRWNDLPDKVILSVDVKEFKSRFDCHMREVRGHI